VSEQCDEACAHAHAGHSRCGANKPNQPSAVEFWYEYSESDDPCSQWYRTYGLEHWVFGPDGRMSSRQVSEPPTIRSDPR
jgi:nuclear transport factor 2 (NTF2) superfamily protein